MVSDVTSESKTLYDFRADDELPNKRLRKEENESNFFIFSSVDRPLSPFDSVNVMCNWP